MPGILKWLFGLLNINIKNEKFVIYLGNILNIAIILLIINIIIKISNKLIEKFFSRQKKLKFGMSEKKADTLSELLKSILKYVLYFIAISSIFEIIWPKVTTTIAITSVLGVAVGFGSQSLVKDIISGFFILFEDQFGVGDYITIDGLSGYVEVLGIRVTKLRDFSGELHVIPNGSISTVTNKTRGNMRALVEVDISYDEDIDRAMEAIKKVNNEVAEEYDTIVEGPEILGVTKFDVTGVTIRIIAKTQPMKQFMIEFELRKRIKIAFDKNNIKLGYSTRVIIDDRGNDINDYKF